MAVSPERLAQLRQMAQQNVFGGSLGQVDLDSAIRQRMNPGPAAKPTGRGGFLSSIISEIGGAGGAAGGAALGASVGSIVPGVGTVAGGLLGALLGGFTGGAGGRLVENKVRDDRFDKKSIREALNEGAWSGLLSGAGQGFQAFKAAKAAKTVAGGADDVTKLASRGTKVVTLTPEQQAAKYTKQFNQALKAGRPQSELDEIVSKIGAVRTVDPWTGKTLLDEPLDTVTKTVSRAKTSVPPVGEIDDLAKAAKLTAGKNASTRAGQSLYRSTLGVDDIVMPGKTKPGTIFKADDLVKEARSIGLKGTPNAMKRQVAVQYDVFSKQVNSALAKSTKTTSAKNLIVKAQKEVADQLPLSIDGVPIRQELTRSLRQLGTGKVNATKLNRFKNSLDVSNAFRKVSGELSSPLTAKETVDLALWKQADDWIAKLAPGAKQLTTRQSRLYGLSQGLGRMTRTPGDPQTVGAILARVGGPGVRKAQNALGRGLMRVGGIESGLGNAVSPGTRSVVGQVARQARFQAPANLVEALSSAGQQTPSSDVGTPEFTDTLGTAPTSFGQEPEQTPITLVEALQQAEQLLGSEATPAQYLSYAKAIMAESASKPIKKTEAQRARDEAAQLTETALQKLAAGSIDTGFLGSKIQGTREFFGQGDPETLDFNTTISALKATIAKARAGTSFTPNEEKLLNAYAPKAGDTRQQLETKLLALQQVFAQAQEREYGSQYIPDQYEETLQYGGEY